LIVFQTLRMRLVVMYVFVAVTLVLIVASAVTAFSLSRVAIGTNDTTTEIVRDAPDVLRDVLSRRGGLNVNASDIVRRLRRPGVRIVVMKAENGVFIPIAFSDTQGARHELVAASPQRSFERPRFPFRLNVLLGLRPKFIDIPGGQIAIFPDPHMLENAMSEFWIAMIPVGVFVGLLAFLLGRYIADQALRPLVETTQSLRSFAAGDFTPRSIAATGRNEIAELVTAYNGAAAQVSSAFAERTKAELEMRQFIADASHELRTPLTAIMGYIDVLSRRANADAATTMRIFETMRTEGRRMKMLIEKLIVLARLENPGEHASEKVDCSDLVRRAVRSLEALGSESRIASHIEYAVYAQAYENDVHDVVSNLLENALKYAPDSLVEVFVRRDEDWAIIEVVDSGPGLSTEDQQHVFDRFYRGKSRAECSGFGLGLAIAKRAVERAGGEILLASTLGEGCRFTVRLPRSGAPDALGKKASELSV
jgi:two-component system, OmpR family, sensor kinase